MSMLKYRRLRKKKEKEISEPGVCINFIKIVDKNSGDCAVGTIRKLRNGVENDDGKCGTCPYFLNEEEIRNAHYKGICDGGKKCKSKTGILTLIAETKWDYDEVKLIEAILKRW